MATKSSTSPELPPEIIRHVLRFFSHDREALRTCALVSQDWLFESRSFLFRNIDILCLQLSAFTPLALLAHVNTPPLIRLDALYNATGDIHLGHI